MIINFLLPFAGNNPIGGFKIVYEYANRLAIKGHTINVIHPSYTFKEDVLSNAKYYGRYIQRMIDKSYNPKWFELNKNVNSLWVRRIENKSIPEADVLIATAWRTAACSMKLDPGKGKKNYLIQSHETWNGSEEEVNATWKLPMSKIVIAKWLQEIAVSMGEEAEYIPNGLDFKEFGIDILPEKREKARVMMLYNELKSKGSSYGIEALSVLKKQFEALEFVLFGVSDRPTDLPEWMEYHKSPTRENLRRLYNSSQVFLSPSLSEGFGLPCAEAMMCGASLAVTNVGGHREFAIDNETACMFPPGDKKKLAESVLLLLNESDLRLRLALNGSKFIKQFSWDKSVDMMEKFLMQR